MRRLFVIVTCMLVVASLALPAGAFAAKGGNGQAKGKASAPGQLKKAEQPAQIAPQPAETEAVTDVSTDGARKNGKGKGLAKDKAGSAGAHASDDGTETAQPDDPEQAPESSDGSETVEPERNGIANAFARISANLAKAEQKVADGSKKSLPPGLVRVFEKFFGWLGLTPDDTTADDPAPDDVIDEPDPSDDETSTPVPPDNSQDPTSSPEPGSDIE